jgi:FtsP/CotA-like multicopper oxidase with cupredoxin domain
LTSGAGRGRFFRLIFPPPKEPLTADMVPDNSGTWLFHCHVTFHNAAGMAARYKVD